MKHNYRDINRNRIGVADARKILNRNGNFYTDPQIKQYWIICINWLKWKYRITLVVVTIRNFVKYLINYDADANDYEVTS
jgi:hypothetical protein